MHTFYPDSLDLLWKEAKSRADHKRKCLRTLNEEKLRYGGGGRHPAPSLKLAPTDDHRVVWTANGGGYLLIRGENGEVIQNSFSD